MAATCSLVSYNDTLAQAAVGPTGIAINKWNRLLVPTPLGSESSKGTSINWPLLRYSDVLLMLAESENELNGPTGPAQDALRKVRQRAFPSNLWSDKVDAYIATISGDKNAFFNAIVNERAWEFGGEMTRKFDLARWNLLRNPNDLRAEQLLYLYERPNLPPMSEPSSALDMGKRESKSKEILRKTRERVKGWID